MTMSSAPSSRLLLMFVDICNHSSTSCLLLLIYRLTCSTNYSQSVAFLPILNALLSVTTVSHRVLGHYIDFHVFVTIMHFFIIAI